MTPLEFITIAEETGLIVPLGQWVLEQACRQVVNWAVQDPRLARLCVAVNLSGRQLREPGLAASAANVLRRTGLDPARLCREHRERARRTDGRETALTSLEELGVSVAVDDFGTGYSSLSVIRALPIEVLKITPRSWSTCQRTMWGPRSSRRLQAWATGWG